MIRRSHRAHVDLFTICSWSFWLLFLNETSTFISRKRALLSPSSMQPNNATSKFSQQMARRAVYQLAAPNGTFVRSAVSWYYVRQIVRQNLNQSASRELRHQSIASIGSVCDCLKYSGSLFLNQCKMDDCSEEQLSEELKTKRICRFCLSQEEPLSDIFASITPTGAGGSKTAKTTTPLTLQIMACVSIEVGSLADLLVF